MKELAISYHLVDHWHELPESDRVLVEQAQKVSQQAYAPYSEFKVGAAARLANGEVVLGSNQENIAYPSGLCAERVALFYAGANFPDVSVETIVIVAHGDLLPQDKILSPCGSCRQVMVESEMRQRKPYRVVLVSQDGRTLIFNQASDLLPFAFGV